MLEAKKQQLLASLEQIRMRCLQLEQELTQRRAQEQQMIGAIILCDELLGAEKGEQAKGEQLTTE